MKYCQHLDNNRSTSITCEREAVIEFHFSYRGTGCECPYVFCPMRRGAQKGSVALCPEHYDLHKDDPPFPDNEIPVEKQWRKL
jgi:hypothetical protein